MSGEQWNKNMNNLYIQQFKSQRLWLILILLVILSLTALWLTNRRGATTKEELMNRYILAIHQNDPDQLLNLLPSSHRISKSELTDLIENWGGEALNITQTLSIPSESPQIEIVKLRGTYKKAGKSIAVEATLYLQKISKRWYLLLGRDANGLPVDAPSSQVE